MFGHWGWDRTTDLPISRRPCSLWATVGIPALNHILAFSLTRNSHCLSCPNHGIHNHTTTIKNLDSSFHHSNNNHKLIWLKYIYNSPKQCGRGYMSSRAEKQLVEVFFLLSLDIVVEKKFVAFACVLYHLLELSHKLVWIATCVADIGAYFKVSNIPSNVCVCPCGSVFIQWGDAFCSSCDLTVWYNNEMETTA